MYGESGRSRSKGTDKGRGLKIGSSGTVPWVGWLVPKILHVPHMGYYENLVAAGQMVSSLSIPEMESNIEFRLSAVDQMTPLY